MSLTLIPTWWAKAWLFASGYDNFQYKHVEEGREWTDECECEES